MVYFRNPDETLIDMAESFIEKGFLVDKTKPYEDDPNNMLEVNHESVNSQNYQSGDSDKDNIKTNNKNYNELDSVLKNFNHVENLDDPSFSDDINNKTGVEMTRFKKKDYTREYADIDADLPEKAKMYPNKGSNDKKLVSFEVEGNSGYQKKKKRY